MKKGDLIFTYGTLRKGETADLSRNPQVSHVGNDRITGFLHNITWFPGVRLMEGVTEFDPALPFVVGDVWQINDAKVVGGLDSYEGYPHLYNRSKVKTESGRTVWVYTYNGHLSSDTLIPNGDWCYKAPEGMETVAPLEPVSTIAASLAGGAAA